jgi:hypothetical protein
MRGRLIYVAQRAYELAQSGNHLDIASVEEAIVAEGLVDGIAWLERPDVKDALQVLCRNSRERRLPRDANNQRVEEPARVDFGGRRTERRLAAKKSLQGEVL